MIIGRSPLRISLGGGGTDIPSYYEKYGGFVISAAIDKYVYVTAIRPFIEGVYLKYSEIEATQNVVNVKHPIIREVLKHLNLKTPQIEITTLADIPSGTGLGSSGSFTTALIKVLYTHYRRGIQTHDLAELACAIEIDMLKEPIGKQDQFIAAFGGITEFIFNKDGRVEPKSLQLTNNTIHDLEDNLLLFYTGISRSAGVILSDQVRKTNRDDKQIIENLHLTKEMGLKSREALLRGDSKLFGYLMHEHWVQKRRRSSSISNSFIDDSYEVGRANGAIGGKLVGAGGGGFLMFYAEDREKLRNAMDQRGLQEVRFCFDFEGTKVILS
jgi:D-glycero-alpha-D-manno-heptose-7-phosphate kinase